MSDRQVAERIVRDDIANGECSEERKEKHIQAIVRWLDELRESRRTGATR